MIKFFLVIIVFVFFHCSQEATTKSQKNHLKWSDNHKIYELIINEYFKNYPKEMKRLPVLIQNFTVNNDQIVEIIGNGKSGLEGAEKFKAFQRKNKNTQCINSFEMKNYFMEKIHRQEFGQKDSRFFFTELEDYLEQYYSASLGLALFSNVHFYIQDGKEWGIIFFFLKERVGEVHCSFLILQQDGGIWKWYSEFPIKGFVPS